VTTTTNGIVLLNKPPEITSFRALGRIKTGLKNYSGQKVKVGHTGTLDKFAEGLLVVLTGKFTRFNPLFTGLDKTYEADILFGRQTDTLDPGGAIVNTAAVPDITVIEDCIPLFTGKIMQRPPLYSAVHVDGERAYKKALKGSTELLPERPVEVYSFELIEWNPPVLSCRISCSKGTYIRSIARDIGTAAGSCASLSALKRTSVGPFSLSGSVSPDDFSAEQHIQCDRKVIEKLTEAIPGKFSIIDAVPDRVAQLKNGAVMDRSFFTQEPVVNGGYAVYSEEEFVSYIEFNDGLFRYVFTG